MSTGDRLTPFEERLRARIVASAKLLSFAFSLAYLLNRAGTALLVRARRIVRFVNFHLTDANSDRLVLGLPELHRRIAGVLEEQRREYPHYCYFYGYPYQALAILGIFGERPTEERFDTYGLAHLVGPGDRVLDIGCNCGFVALYTAYRTGCRVTGVDINPYMIRIGQLCAEYLRISDRTELIASTFQDFNVEADFSVVFSFATHWTDDGKYRVQLLDHLRRIHGLLAPNGLLVFESHCADVGQESFYAALESARGLFQWGAKILSDNARREVYLMRKL